MFVLNRRNLVLTWFLRLTSCHNLLHSLYSNHMILLSFLQICHIFFFSVLERTCPCQFFHLVYWWSSMLYVCLPNCLDKVRRPVLHSFSTFPWFTYCKVFITQNIFVLWILLAQNYWALQCTKHYAKYFTNAISCQPRNNALRDILSIFPI